MALFYEITAPNGSKSYLFGTIHTDNEEVNTLPQEIKRAFETASVFYFEAPEVDGDMDSLLQEWNIKHGNAHKEWTSNSLNTQEMSQKLANFYPKQSLWAFFLPYLTRAWILRYPPILVRSSVQIFGLTSKNTLDHNLDCMAKKRHREVRYLEKPQEQINALVGTSFTYEEQHRLIDDYSVGDKDRLLNMYLNDEIDAQFLESLINKFSEDKRPLAQGYYEGLITARDKRMADKLKMPFLQGGAFVAVGAMHLPGITQVYREKGFTIQAINLSQRVYPVLDYYERNHNQMYYTGLAYVLAGTAAGIGLAFSLHILGIGLLLASTVLAAYALISTGILAYKYITQPMLDSMETLTLVRPNSASSIIDAYLKDANSIVSPNMRDLFEHLARKAPMLFLDEQGPANIEKILNYPKGADYQLAEAFIYSRLESEPLDQNEFDEVIEYKDDPRDWYRQHHVKLSVYTQCP